MRSERCCYIGNAWNVAVDHPTHMRDNPWLIGRRNVPTRENMLELLRHSIVLVSYDPVLPFLADAQEAGCPVHYVQADGTLA